MVTKGINGNINLEEVGGNAITNLRFEAGSYQQQGSGWAAAYIVIYGEAVLVD